MNEKAASPEFDYCGVGTFAAMTGIAVEKVANWLETGMLPSVRIGDLRMVNLDRIRRDLIKGKSGFTEGDYRDEDSRGSFRFS